MPMSDELAGATLSYSQKAMEIAAELVKMITPAIKSGAEKLISIAKNTESEISGTVKRSSLFVEAKKESCNILSTSNFIDTDVDKIAAKAKEYHIPVSFVGNDGKQTMEFLSRDESVINQIIQDIMQERLQEAPQNIKSFAVSEGNVAAVKEQLEKNGVECQFAQSANGKIYCMYPAEEAEKVAAIKQDFKQMQTDVAEKFKVSRNTSGIAVMEDAKLGKSISFVNEKKQPLTKSHVMEVMQEQFGYSKAEANLAANKLCDELNLEHSQFLAHNEQLEIINSFNTNIKFQNDSILLKDTTFTSVNFKGGSGTHIFITNGDKKAALSPATMSETEMMKICTTTLGMKDEQAAEAVSKAKKIDEQINAKLHQTTIYRNDGVQQVEIERKSKNSFSVRVGNTEKEYDFADPNLAAKLSKDFGITEGKANNIIDHAQKQSALMNRVEKAFNKTAKSVKEKTEKTVKDVSKGVKR